MFNPQNAQFPGASGAGNLPGSAQGPQGAFLLTGGEASSNLTSASPLTIIQANTTYTLTVAFGVRLDFPATNRDLGQIYLGFNANGSTFTDSGTYLDAKPVPVGTFTDFAFTFTTGATGPLIGQNLTVTVGYVASNSNPSGVLVDNIRVEAIPAIGRLANVSILTSLAGAADSFTMGYVVGGAGTSGTKPVVIRAAGPSLSQFGVASPLADPKLEFFAGQTKSGENDNWGGAAAILGAFTAVQAFPFNGPTSLDAAVSANVAAGDNSVKISPVGNLSGAVIAEIYEATSDASFTPATPRLINVSVLKNIGTTLTAGFVIGGAGPRSVLLRAVGPTLGAAPFNVGGVVADPQLALFAGSTQIGDNDNWGGTAALTAAFTSVGAFALPAASRDAALLVTLAPGNYSVQVSGIGNTTGIALVEVYEVP